MKTIKFIGNYTPFTFKLLTLLTFTFSLSALWAQSPEKMSYQAVVRNASDDLVVSSTIGMRVSILQGSTGGTAVYVETKTPATNANGLVTIEIGAGSIVSGVFSAIDWSNGPYFLKTETDPAGGTNYTITGTSQLLSVPYALHAKTAENITETDPVFGASVAKGITGIDTAAWNAKSNFSGSYDNLTETPDLGLKLDTIATASWDRNKNDDFSGNWSDLSGKPDFSKWDKDSTDNVMLTGTQTIAGSKTFSNTIITSNGINASNKSITNLADPANGQDAATKAYVDALITQLYEQGAIRIRDNDGNYYNTIKIGDQIWMAENLKTTNYNDGTAIPQVSDSATWSNLTTDAYCSYNNSTTNKATYGTLYNWYTVNTGKLCPTGWHVPSDAEWETLSTYLGGESIAGGKMKETGTAHWTSSNIGATNESGFTALPGGYRGNAASFRNIGIHGNWWSSLLNDPTNAWSRSLSNDVVIIYKNLRDKKYGFSVRCLMD